MGGYDVSDPARPPRSRLGAPRRDRPSRATPLGPGHATRRRPTDGRGKPRPTPGTLEPSEQSADRGVEIAAPESVWPTRCGRCDAPLSTCGSLLRFPLHQMSAAATGKARTSRVIVKRYAAAGPLARSSGFGRCWTNSRRSVVRIRRYSPTLTAAARQTRFSLGHLPAGAVSVFAGGGANSVHAMPRRNKPPNTTHRLGRPSVNTAAPSHGHESHEWGRSGQPASFSPPRHSRGPNRPTHSQLAIRPPPAMPRTRLHRRSNLPDPHSPRTLTQPDLPRGAGTSGIAWARHVALADASSGRRQVVVCSQACLQDGQDCCHQIR